MVPTDRPAGSSNSASSSQAARARVRRVAGRAGQVCAETREAGVVGAREVERRAQQAFLDLDRRLAREGDRDDGARVGAGEAQPHVAVDQHLGLAGTGGRGERDAERGIGGQQLHGRGTCAAASFTCTSASRRSGSWSGARRPRRRARAPPRGRRPGTRRTRTAACGRARSGSPRARAGKSRRAAGSRPPGAAAIAAA